MSLVMCKGCRRWVSFLYVEDCQHCFDVLIANYWPQDIYDVLRLK